MITNFDEFDKKQDIIKESINTLNYKNFKAINEFDPVTGATIFSLFGGEDILKWALGLWSSNKIINHLSKNIPGSLLNKIDKILKEYSKIQLEKIKDYKKFIKSSENSIQKAKSNKKEDDEEFKRDLSLLRKNISRQENLLMEKYKNKIIPINKKLEDIKRKYSNNRRVMDYIDEKKRIIDNEIIEIMGKFLEESTDIIWDEKEKKERLKDLEEKSKDIEDKSEELEKEYKGDIDNIESDDLEKEEIDPNKLGTIKPQQVWETINGEVIKIIKIEDDKIHAININNNKRGIIKPSGLRSLRDTFFKSNRISMFERDLDIETIKEIMRDSDIKSLLDFRKVVFKENTKLKPRKEFIQLKINTKKENSREWAELKDTKDELEDDIKKNTIIIKLISDRLSELGYKKEKGPFKIPKQETQKGEFKVPRREKSEEEFNVPKKNNKGSNKSREDNFSDWLNKGSNKSREDNFSDWLNK